MKKTLLTFGIGFLAAVLLVSVYAFQTDSDTDVVIMSHTGSMLRITNGAGETKKVEIWGMGPSQSGLQNQINFNKTLLEYKKNGYSLKAISPVSSKGSIGSTVQYILEKN